MKRISYSGPWIRYPNLGELPRRAPQANSLIGTMDFSDEQILQMLTEGQKPGSRYHPRVREYTRQLNKALKRYDSLKRLPARIEAWIELQRCAQRLAAVRYAKGHLN